MYNKLSLDGTPDVKYHGSIVYAKNKILDKVGKNLITEPGFDEICNSEIDIIGLKTTNRDIIIFGIKTISSIKYSFIKVFNIETGILETIIKSRYLNFNYTNPIIAIAYYNYKNELITNWIDGVEDSSNYIRTLNLTKPLIQLDASKELVNPSDVTLLSIKPNIKIPKIEFKDLTPTGSLKTGAYTVFIGYEYKDGRSTDFINSSNQIYINNVITTDPISKDNYAKIEGLQSNITTSFAINLTLVNLDTLATKIKIGVVYSNDRVYTSYSKTIPLLSSTQDITIDSISSFADVGLDEILKVTNNYTKASSITSFKNRAIYGDLKSNSVADIQKYVNNISVNWTSNTNANYYNNVGIYNPLENYKSPSFQYYNKSFTPNEVVALYLRVFHLDGSILGDYHIPGRLPHGTEDYTLVKGNPQAKEIDIDVITSLKDDYTLNDTVKYFQTRDTSSIDGEMGYWENQNEFYDNDDNWDVYNVVAGNGVYVRTNKNMNVRHHRFPSLETLVDKNYTHNTLPVLGLNISNIKFPTAILNQIQGYQIMYAARTGLNNLVQDEAILHFAFKDDEDDKPFTYGENRLRTGTKHAQDYLYVCRPYNLINNNDALLASYIKVNYNAETINCDSWINISPPSGVTNLYHNAIGLTDNNYMYNLNSGAKPTNSGFIKLAIPAEHKIKKIATSGIMQHGGSFNNIGNAIGDIMLGIELDNSSIPLIKNNESEEDPSGTPLSAFNYTYDGELHNRLSSGYFYNVSLMIFKEDVYLSFEDQELVKCSDIIYKDSESLIVNNGDTFIGLHAYRTFSRNVIGGTTISEEYSLFAVPTYSTSNIELRYGTQPFYPNLSDRSITPITFIELARTIYNSTLTNLDFNTVNKFKQSVIYNSLNSYISYYPDIFIISNVNSTESLINQWSNINSDSYVTTDMTTGKIISLNASDNILYIQKRDSLYVIRLNDEIINTGTANISLQQQDIFNAKLEELVPFDDNGYLGTKERFGNCITPYGYVVLDSDKCKIYLVEDTKVKDITTGIYEYLLKFKSYFNISDSNPFYELVNSGVTMTYNDLEDSVYISFHTTGYQTETNEVDEPGLTIAKTFTLSYNLKTAAYISFHSHIPSYLTNNRNNVFSVKYGRIYKHNSSLNNCMFYKNKSDNTYVKHDDIVDYIFNSLMNDEGAYVGSNTLKIFNNFEIDSFIVDRNNKYIYDRMMDKVAVYNDTQCSKELTISSNSWFKNNHFRIIHSKGYLNYISDNVKDDTLPFIDEFTFSFINSNLTLKNFYNISKFISNFVVLRLIHTNTKDTSETYIINNIHSKFNIK